MHTLYLIGGGPNAGKTTTAKELSHEHGLKYVKADKYIDEHQTEASKRKYPINTYLNELKGKEFELELIRLTAKQELARHTELFLIFLEELKEMEEYDSVIVEGNFLLPDLVSEHLGKYSYKAVWLIPTVEFQNRVYLQQDWATELIQASDDPALTLKSWIKRDERFNDQVRTQAEAHDYSYLTIDGKEPIERTIEWVEKQFDLAT